MEDKENIIQLVEKYLNNEATLYERARIDSWVESDEQLNEWLDECIENAGTMCEADVRERLYQRIDELYKTAGETDSVENDQSRGLKARLRLWQYGMAAAVAVIVMMAGVLVHNFNMPAPENALTVATNSGERSHVTLPDGSTVVLNYLSTVKYAYDSNRGERTVELSGEAAFDIESDPEHPFIVNCGDLRIQCLGTSFDVKGYNDERDITVVLSDGAIKASTSQQEITIKPGTKVNFDKSTKSMSSTAVEASDYTGWTQGTERFNNDCLDDILRSVSRQYGVEINIITPSLRGERLSGSIGKKSLDETLNIIAAASETKYIVESDSTICFYREL